MKIQWGEIDWAGMIQAVVKAVFPFLAGALGGISVSGCAFVPVVGA